MENTNGEKKFYEEPAKGKYFNLFFNNMLMFNLIF